MFDLAYIPAFTEVQESRYEVLVDEIHNNNKYLASLHDNERFALTFLKQANNHKNKESDIDEVQKNHIKQAEIYYYAYLKYSGK